MWLPHRRRRLVQQKVDTVLSSRRLPRTSGLVIKVARCDMISAIRSAVNTAILRNHLWDVMVKDYVRRSSRFVVGKTPTFADQQNCSSRARDFDWALLRDPCDEDLAAAISGAAAAVRVEANWDIAVPPTISGDKASLGRALRRWVSAVGLDSDYALMSRQATVDLCASASWKAIHRHSQMVTSRHPCTSQLVRPRGHILCPDDKVRQFKWLVPMSVYFLMMMWFVMVSSNWTSTCLEASEANAWCAAVLVKFVPAALHKQFGIRPGQWFLPYCYCSIKAKCFGQGLHRVRTCQVENHSCVSRIVSFASWPCRRAWRWVGRAITFLVRGVLMTDETSSLRDARPLMDEKISRLLPPRRPGYCDRCNGPCLGMQGLVADAGQFFEAVSVEEACRSLDQILARAREDGIRSLTVVDDKHVFVGGCIFRSLKTCRVFALVELYWLFAASCCMKFAQTGTKVWTYTGLLIGGMLSKVATSCVLGLQEHNWCTDSSLRAAASYHWPDRMWSHMVARSRYCDDVLWISRSLCTTCLQAAIAVVYTVPFDTQFPTADHKLTWLDFCISLQPLTWAPRPPGHVDKRYVFAVLAGRVARLRQMQLGALETVEALICLFSDFTQAGWSKRMLRKSVYRVATRCPHPHSRLIVLVFHAWFR